MLVGDIITSNARLYPNKICVVDDNGRLTWAQFNDRVNRLVNVLFGLGLKKGDRLALCLENRHEFAEILFAVAKAGFITVCLNYRLTTEQMLRIVNDCQPRAIIIEEKYVTALERVAKNIEFVLGIGKKHGCPYDYEASLTASSSAEPQVELQEQDIFCIKYTTGTTGTSKGAIITHKNEITSSLMRLQATANTHDDVVLIAAPLFAAGVQTRFFGASLLGCTSVMTSFSAENFVNIVERERVTYASLMPTTFRMVKEYLQQSPRQYDLSSLRKFQTEGGQHCSGNDLRDMLDYFHIPYNVASKPYGMTEAMPATHLIPGDVAAGLSPTATEKEKKRLESIGKPLFNGQVRVVDENDNDIPRGQVGEIIIRGDQITKGYWNNPELTARALRGGWFHSSDLGLLDEDGYLFFSGRKDFVIKTGGLLVGPEEVEAVIMEHPAVAEVAVIGLSNEKWGQAVTAITCLKPGYAITGEEIIDHCRKRLASFQLPKKVIFAEKLPRDIAYSKINRLELIRTYGRTAG
jgi:acyl-CoA synthetase (AMP-forming)/AMP-acid ligase II